MARLMLAEGLSAASIGLHLAVTTRTVNRWRLNYKVWGEAYPPYGRDCTTKQGRPLLLTTEQQRFMLAYLSDRPTTYLNEVALVL